MTAPWPRNGSFGGEGLVIAGRSATALADEFGTPLIVVDEDDFRTRCRDFLEAFGRALWAVKSFPAQALIRIAVEEGLGLLAATGGEVDACLRAGAPAARIWLHGNNKLDEEIDQAVAARLDVVILDSEEDVVRLEAAAERAGTAQGALLRIVPEVESGTHPYVRTGGRDTKFGVPLAEGMALAALKRALGSSAIDVRGIHVHVGSQLLSPEPYLAEIDAVLEFFVEAKAALGFSAAILDVGGGFGVTYTDEDALPPELLAKAIFDRVAAGCRASGLDIPTLVAEPGRAIASNAAVTLYRVGSMKVIPGVRTYVAVDGGMSDNIRPALYEARYVVALAGRTSAAPTFEATVVGRHCESGDVLARDVPLPDDLRRGDLVALGSTGSYEYAMASNYNKVGRPAVVLVREGTPRLVLRREDPADLAGLEVGVAVTVDASPPPGVEVRAARRRDARGVIDLLREVVREGRYIRMTDVRMAPAELRRRFRSAVTPDHADLVAVADDRLIGQLFAAREAGSVTRHVASLGMAVAADWRARGVGSALMAEAVRWARSSGVAKLALSVYPHNTAAIALYRKFGFVEEGRLTGHSKKETGYEDEIVMGMWL